MRRGREGGKGQRTDSSEYTSSTEFQGLSGEVKRKKVLSLEVFSPLSSQSVKLIPKATESTLGVKA